MNNQIALNNELSAKDDSAVKDAIERINALYAPICENAQNLRTMFDERGIKNRIAFYNNHAVAVGDGYVNELYPIPIVTATLAGVSVDIGFDLVSHNGKIGTMEFTVDKAVLIALDFSKLTGFEFAIFGVEHYHDEYWFGDVEATKKLIENCDEQQFHIGFEFSDLVELYNILNVFIGANDLNSGEGDSAPKMLDKK